MIFVFYIDQRSQQRSDPNDFPSPSGDGADKFRRPDKRDKDKTTETAPRQQREVNSRLRPQNALRDRLSRFMAEFP